MYFPSLDSCSIPTYTSPVLYLFILDFRSIVKSTLSENTSLFISIPIVITLELYFGSNYLLLDGVAIGIGLYLKLEDTSPYSSTKASILDLYSL